MTALKAMVVEDGPGMAERIAELITIPGRVEVVTSHSTADSALVACERFALDFAVIDLQLAQGTGFEVIRQLERTRREAGRAITIVVLTNHAVPALKVAAFEAGADYFLDKAKDFASLPRLAAELAHKVAA